MGSIRQFTPEKLVLPLLVASGADFAALSTELESRFGPIDYRSPPILFDFTRYYEAEMGRQLTRYLLAFESLVAPDSLAQIKITTNEIEAMHSAGGARSVNLDPGVLGLSRFILASTKDNGRRVPLRDGIHAEITLVYRHGDFHPLEWTYPDFRTRAYRDLLLAIRTRYREQLKAVKRE